jgi:hypothetical protein
MEKYHKIQTIYERTNIGKIIIGNYSIPEFGYLKGNLWSWREKLDGMNIRVRYNSLEKKIDFKGKTDREEIPQQLGEKLLSYFTLDKFERVFIEAKQVCFYGEGIGPKIQSGGEYSVYQDFVLFDIWVDGLWMRRETIENIASLFKVQICPIVGYGNLFELCDFVKKGFISQWGDFIAEGVVATPLIELKNRRGGRIITKIKYKDFIND